VSDDDTTKLVKELVTTDHTLVLLRYSQVVRAYEKFFWYSMPEEQRNKLNSKIKAAGGVLSIFPNSTEFDYIVEELTQEIEKFLAKGTLNKTGSTDAYTITGYVF